MNVEAADTACRKGSWVRKAEAEVEVKLKS